ncbi:DEAD/DEAH box helicase [Nocardioides insulae]|uniref:DEAD/DEAH box helicase n=1 Tax=Nocardioides insulae TaxID=394734 RepID=UPI00048CD859|nr:DEAD/DEAH box helicase [Nocardioides insulae]
MSFVPLTGPASLAPAESAREGTITFTDARRSVALPMRAAIPVLTKARDRADAHASVGLLAGSVLLALQLVAAGKFRPEGEGWRPVIVGEDAERVRLLAEARAYDALGPEAAEGVVRGVLDAVVDAMPHVPPRSGGTRRAGGSARASRPGTHPGSTRPADTRTDDFVGRLQARVESHLSGSRIERDELAQLVRISLRVEADEEELRGGSVRLVLQVHDETDPLRLADAALLWTGDPREHGFGERARTHVAVLLRGAADAWPVLDRLLDLRVPDEITLESDEIASLLEDGVAALQERGVDVMWPRSLGRDLTTSAVLDRAPRRDTDAWADVEPLNTGLLGPEAVFAFRWQAALHGEPLTEEEMDQLAAAASPLLKLRGTWTVVHPDVARKARKRLLRTVKPAEALGAALSGVVQVGEEREEVIVGASVGRLREQVLGAGAGDPLPEPAGLAATLRDYQRHGVSWLADLTAMGLGGCLADDMGLGKTITLIALHLHRRDTGLGGPTLVVCPASLLGNWEAEIQRFAPGVPVRRFHGSVRDLTGLAPPVGAGHDPATSGPAEAPAPYDAGFVLTTYGTMRSDAVRLAAVPWGLVVADEAQHIKNSRSATARMLRTIPSRARVALTGTPVENDLTELWSILDWTVPGLLGSRNAFRRVWAAPVEAGIDTVARQFAELIRPFLLRRRKSDPGIAPELPRKTETDHLLRLTREQTVLYEAFVRDTMERIERADEATRRGLVLMLLTGLKQICNHPAQFLKQAGGRIGGRSQKLDLLDELLATVLAEDGGVLVFTQYVAMARLLERHWHAAGLPHQFLHGGTPVREREAMVTRFQAGEVPVFLLSLKAGGTGLNLTRADHVIHVDRWWNPAVEDQATDRAYRIGQTRPVQVHRLITRGTVETRIAELLTRKRALADAVLGAGEGALTELSNAELRDLVTLEVD